MTTIARYGDDRGIATTRMNRRRTAKLPSVLFDS